MRKFLFPGSRPSALTARITSPFLRGPMQADTTNVSAGTTNIGSANRADTHTMTDRDYANAAIRFSRTLW